MPLADGQIAQVDTGALGRLPVLLGQFQRSRVFGANHSGPDLV